jgi:hypothetical protein
MLGQMSGQVGGDLGARIWFMFHSQQKTGLVGRRTGFLGGRKRWTRKRGLYEIKWRNCE